MAGRAPADSPPSSLLGGSWASTTCSCMAGLCNLTEVPKLNGADHEGGWSITSPGRRRIAHAASRLSFAVRAARVVDTLSTAVSRTGPRRGSIPDQGGCQSGLAALNVRSGGMSLCPTRRARSGDGEDHVAERHVRVAGSTRPIRHGAI